MTDAPEAPGGAGPTPLDLACAAARDAGSDPALDGACHSALAAAELFVLLRGDGTAEAVAGGELVPQVFRLSDGPLVAAFDSEARLAAFAEGPAAYAALPGRALLRHLDGQGLALGLNLGIAPSQMVLPPEAVAWLASRLPGAAPEARHGALRAVMPPRGPSPALLRALDGRLARAAGMASHAWLASVAHEDGSTALLLAFVDAVPGSETVLAAAVAEALALVQPALPPDLPATPPDAPAPASMPAPPPDTPADASMPASPPDAPAPATPPFARPDAPADASTLPPLDIVFVASGDTLAARLAAVALRFDLPRQHAPNPVPPAPPGSDPSRPPRLK